MRDEDKTKDQLVSELKELRQQMDAFEQVEKSRRLVIENLMREKILSEATIDSLPGVFYLFDNQGRLLRWNENLEISSQYTTEEIARMYSEDFFNGEDKIRVTETIKDTFSKGRADFEANLIAKDGSIKPYLFSGRRLALDDDEYVVGMGINISARKRVEEAFKNLVFNAPIGIFIVRDKKFSLVNPAFQAITGYSDNELLGEDCLCLVKSEFKERVRIDAVDMLKGKKSYPYEYEAINKNGQTIHIMESVTSISFNGGSATLGYFMDITEREKIEKQLVLAQRMESIGILAGGIAHDFNNLLMAIKGYGEIMMMECPNEDPVLQYAQEILKAANRGAALTNQLLAFGRKQILQPRVLNLNTEIASIERMLRRLIGEDIELATVLDPALGTVKFDPGQIEQVIMNLAVNARDAMPRGGNLTIETTNIYLDEAYAQGHVAVTPGPYVMLAVSDNGMGMDAETQAHIFDPFFTTKEYGKGTGLGLATVYGIVQQSRGFIWVYSEPGEGTTFKIYFPRVQEAAEEIKPRVPTSESLHGQETILLVEDDEMLRGMISKALRKYGYLVKEACHGGEALLLCDQHEGPIHLLLTDVVMPQMSGSTLAQRLTQSKPGLRVIYISGYTENAIAQHGILEAGVNFLQKPVKIASLVRKVREVLDEPQAGESPRREG